MSDIPVVVRNRIKGGVKIVEGSVYIGRNQFQGGWKLKKSIWANPFSAKTYGREKSIEMYREYIVAKIVEDPETWVDNLADLIGQTLGCWCKDQPYIPCHGDVLVDLVTTLLDSLDSGDPDIFINSL